MTQEEQRQYDSARNEALSLLRANLYADFQAVIKEIEVSMADEPSSGHTAGLKLRHSAMLEAYADFIRGEAAR